MSSAMTAEAADKIWKGNWRIVRLAHSIWGRTCWRHLAVASGWPPPPPRERTLPQDSPGQISFTCYLSKEAGIHSPAQMHVSRGAAQRKASVTV